MKDPDSLALHLINGGKPKNVVAPDVGSIFH